MRLSVRSLRQVVQGVLAVQFVPQQPISYTSLDSLARDARQLTWRRLPCVSAAVRNG